MALNSPTKAESPFAPRKGRSFAGAKDDNCLRNNRHSPTERAGGSSRPPAAVTGLLHRRRSDKILQHSGGRRRGRGTTLAFPVPTDSLTLRGNWLSPRNKASTEAPAKPYPSCPWAVRLAGGSTGSGGCGDNFVPRTAPAGRATTEHTTYCGS